ncbi:hypothetical protein GCM10009548_31620 [Streptomyces malaysiensis subsp. malaysiensis]|uniref:Serine kinase n=1 Tax=Streptomyces malaysiensis TaxID=92644 RepID=A0ABX6WE67_STRMQ|nr:hypothetical protein [Streptomyces solisilvae]ATL86862.1 hypothetical protein SMALA_6641 [Streptomyces malaysiensis]QPI59744.1 hypothetical protein I1A49_36980 [Streptomyces solisilvae]
MSSEGKIIARCTGTAVRAVEVEVPADVWPVVEEYLSGFVAIGPARPGDKCWRVVLAVQADGTHEATAAHYGDYDDTLVWREIDGAQRVVRLTASATSAYAPVHVVRIVRTLLRLDAAEHDPSASFLHAGMVAWQGLGIALVGNKRSGKTSTVIAATAAGAHFVSNDDLSLHEASDGPTGVGWPRSVSIRLDTLEPLGLSLPTRTAHPANTHRDEAQLLMPHEIGAMFNGRLLRKAPLQAVVFPSFGADDTATLRRLAPGEAAERLLANLLTPPVKDDELTSWFKLPTPEELSARVRQVAAGVPAFELRQSLTHLACRPELARVLDQAVAVR